MNVSRTPGIDISWVLDGEKLLPLQLNKTGTTQGIAGSSLQLLSRMLPFDRVAQAISMGVSPMRAGRCCLVAADNRPLMACLLQTAPLTTLSLDSGSGSHQLTPAAALPPVRAIRLNIQFTQLVGSKTQILAVLG